MDSCYTFDVIIYLTLKRRTNELSIVLYLYSSHKTTTFICETKALFGDLYSFQ